MSSEAVALLAALPWIVIPVVSAVRLRHSRSIAEFSAEAAPETPLVSVIIPARDEERNIERCLRSVLGTSYPNVEIILVDDHSSDRTRQIATAIQRSDPRVLVFAAPELPRGWFGKQWACWTGAARARGEVLCFTDADTEHAPDLLPRCVNAMHVREADLFTVMGRQEMVTVWEKLVQPQVFGMLNFWYGGTESVTRSRRWWRKIANGQFLMIARAVYEETGGHEAVRTTVAEDLGLAQRFHRLGRRVVFMLAREQLSTRMYSSLGELVRGWSKNIYAGGVHALPENRLLRGIFPLLLVLPPLVVITPPLALLAGALGFTSAPVLLWAIVATAASLLAWVVIYMNEDESPLYGMLYPFGAAVMLYIVLRAIGRGMRVNWKGRDYRSRGQSC